MGIKCCKLESLSQDSFLQMQLIYCAQELAHLRKVINNFDVSQLTKPYIFGNWTDSNQTGLGIIYMPNQYYYQGSIREGKSFGPGKIIWKNEDLYFGSFREGKLSGLGKLISPKKNIEYSGEWYEGYPTIGNILYNGAKLEVNFANSSKIVIKLIDGSVYCGEITKKNNQYVIHGKGRMSYPNKTYYQGEWKQGKMHGKGIFVWNRLGKRYEGDYKNGKKEGFGKYYFSNEKWYEGQWKDGKQHGQGAIYQQNCKIWYGKWNNGIQQERFQQGCSK